MHSPRHEVGSRRLAAGQFPIVPARPKLHRIEEVLKREGVSLKTARRNLNLPAAEVQRQVDPRSDLKLSELYKWQKLLQVPISEFIAEPDESLSPNVLLRVCLLKAMKTVRSIEKNADSEATASLAKRLVKQLLDVMPELAEVSAWNTVGQRRTSDELGKAADRCLPETIFEGTWDGEYLPL